MATVPHLVSPHDTCPLPTCIIPTTAVPHLGSPHDTCLLATCMYPMTAVPHQGSPHDTFTLPTCMYPLMTPSPDLYIHVCIPSWHLPLTYMYVPYDARLFSFLLVCCFFIGGVGGSDESTHCYRFFCLYNVFQFFVIFFLYICYEFLTRSIYFSQLLFLPFILGTSIFKHKR
jgi:hypothetical protein